MTYDEVVAALEAHILNRTGDVYDQDFIELCALADRLGVPNPWVRYFDYLPVPRGLNGYQPWVAGTLDAYRRGLLPENWLRVSSEGEPPYTGGICHYDNDVQVLTFQM